MSNKTTEVFQLNILNRNSKYVLTMPRIGGKVKGNVWFSYKLL